MRCSIPTRSSSSAWRSTARRSARSQRFPETTPTISAGSSADWSSDCKRARPSRPLRRLTACQRDDRIGIGDSDAGYRRDDAVHQHLNRRRRHQLGDRRPRRERRGLRHQRLERPAERRPHQRIGVAVAAHIVCGIDHTSGGDRAAATAAQLARDLRCEVSLVHVMRGAHLGKSGDTIAIDAAEEHRWLQELSREYGLAPNTPVAVFGGDPADALIEAADAEDAEFIVVGSRGLHELGNAVLGSVSCALMRKAPCPVVVAPPALPVPPVPLSLRPVVCGVEGSDRDQPTLRLAADLALRLGAELRAVHAFNPRPVALGPAAVMPPLMPTLSGAAEATLEHAVTEAGVEARRCVVASPAAEGLMQVADETGAGLIVVGSQGRGKLGSALYGSVAIRLAAEARVPVVVLPPDALLEGGSGHYEV